MTRSAVALAEVARPITGSAGDWDALVARMARCRFVLLGEATHGTHAFYRERARLTQRLLVDHGFDAVAVEADWPDALRVSRYVRGGDDDQDAAEALADFERFPTWMWRNADVLDFVGWLRDWNEACGGQVGFYGLDLYSLHRSMTAVTGYLDRRDPTLAAAAREHYACFDRFGEDPQLYGYETTHTRLASCRDDVAAQLVALRKKREALIGKRDGDASDEHFYAEQNAAVAVSAEAYYRAMFAPRTSSWNLRDTHMADTLDALAAHLERRLGRKPRIVVWAHNSHVGDARATAMGDRGELTLGQLVRERHGNEAFALGFTTYTGTVTAASDWDGAAERKRVRPALDGSWEELFHHVGRARFWLDTREPAVRAALEGQRLQRAIGVVYRPETERWSHWFEARIAEQFDAIAHFDTTRAVEPLERSARWTEGELPDTWPSTL
jgi:erythromycin esterase-like protein